MIRRFLHCASTFALLYTLVGLTAAATCPPIGAIRWDGWFGEKGIPGQAVEKSLGPGRWRARLPVCGKVIDAEHVKIACDGADQMNREIAEASSAGIAYWAFVAYADDDPMSIGLRTYLASSSKTKLGFALISELDKWGNRTLYSAVIKRYIALMADPAYQKTDGGRPIFFLGFVSDATLDSRFGGRASFGRLVEEFRVRAKDAGLGNPYIVLLDKNVPRGQKLIHELGLDAISAYAVADNDVRQGDYKQLAQGASAFWAQSRAADLSVVPPVMTGWDRRPRVQNPVPWEGTRFSEEQMNRYYKPPTPTELQNHLTAAIRWAQQPTQVDMVKSILIYAWNEFDEGGWLAPTLGDGTARLDAVRHAITSSCSIGGTSR